jgi:hypothetical protein
MTEAPIEKKTKPEPDSKKECASEEIKKKENDSKDLSATPQTSMHKSTGSTNQPQYHKTNYKGDHLLSEKEALAQNVPKQPPHKPGFRMKMR